MNTLIRVKEILLSAALLAGALSGSAWAQGGTGSHGGVVLACFGNSDTDPKAFVNKVHDAWVWPAIDSGGSSQRDIDDRVVQKARNLYAVSQLTNVEVDEYRSVVGVNYGVLQYPAPDDLFSNAHYHLHPLLYLIRQLALETKAPPIVLPIPADRLQRGANPLNRHELTALSKFVDDTDREIDNFNAQNLGRFNQIYKLVADLFIGVPGFHARLARAHELVKPIPLAGSNTSGNMFSQWDVDLSNVPYPQNCVQMTAVVRRTHYDVNKKEFIPDITYDRYLLHRMDLFQRVLLQLHEEFYFMGADVPPLGLGHARSGPSRNLLTAFLRGDRVGPDGHGYFVTPSCTVYDQKQDKQSPLVSLTESYACMSTLSIGAASRVLPIDQNFVPIAVSGRDALTFLYKFLCSDDVACAPFKKSWQKIALFYGPYAPTPLARILENNEGGSFGSFSTIDDFIGVQASSTVPSENLLENFDSNTYCRLVGHPDWACPNRAPN